MSSRPEVVSLTLCPICGVELRGEGACLHCGTRRNSRGWFEADQDHYTEVPTALALVRATVPLLARQTDESDREWIERLMDFVGPMKRKMDGKE